MARPRDWAVIENSGSSDMKKAPVSLMTSSAQLVGSSSAITATAIVPSAPDSKRRLIDITDRNPSGTLPEMGTSLAVACTDVTSPATARWRSMSWLASSSRIHPPVAS